MFAASSFDPRHPLKSLTIPRDALRPPSADNPRLGLTLSALAHAGLVVALAIGVSWHTAEPEGVTAELWSAVPEIAAPRVEPQPAPEVAPPPPPPVVTPPQPSVAEREAEIAIEKVRKEQLEKERREALDQKAREKRLKEEQERKAEKERLEREKAESKEREKAKLEQQRKEQASATAREKARQDQLRRMNEQLGGSGAPTSTGTAARDAGPSSSYAGRIVARIRPNIQLPFEVSGNPTTEVRLIVMPDGTITKSNIVKPSGVKEWDDAVIRAIEKTAVLPRDENGRVPSPMVLSVSRFPKS